MRSAAGFAPPQTGARIRHHTINVRPLPGQTAMTDDPTPDKILQLGLGFWGSKTLLTAVELGVFTELAAGPLPVDALAARLGLHPRSARDFLDALVALRVLDRDAAGHYRNTTEADAFLDRAKPSYVGGLLEMANARLYAFWGSLTEALRTGLPQNEAKDGVDTFAALYADPARLEGFLRGMTGISRRPPGRSPRSSRGGTTAPSPTSGPPKGRCRPSWPWPTRTCPASVSTCRRSGRSSSGTSGSGAWRNASRSKPGTSSGTRCLVRTCW